MAIENLNFVVGHLAAAANYSATGQYRGMVASASADHTAVLASVAGQQIIGILRNEPESGEACEIVIEGVAKGIAGGTIVRGDRLSVDANGAFVASTGAGAIVGVALESAASGAIFSLLMHPRPLSRVTLGFNVTLTALPGAGDLITSYPLPGAGRIVGFRYFPQVVTSTAGDGMNLNLEIGTTNLTGGVLGLTSANTNTLGVVVEASAITGANTYAPGALLSIESATGAGSFAEGSGVLHVDVELF
jgi:hypothetical protein